MSFSVEKLYQSFTESDIVDAINARATKTLVESLVFVTSITFTDRIDKFRLQPNDVVLSYETYYEHMRTYKLFEKMTQLHTLIIDDTNATTYVFPQTTAADTVHIRDNVYLNAIVFSADNNVYALTIENNSALLEMPETCGYLKNVESVEIVGNKLLQNCARLSSLSSLQFLHIMHNPNLTAYPSTDFLNLISYSFINKTEIDTWLHTAARENVMRTYTYPNFVKKPYMSYLPSSNQKVVYVVGDIHGDYEAALVCLRDVCNVMKCSVDPNTKDVKYTWIAKPSTVVIILGDVVDRARQGEYSTPGEVPFEEVRILDMINQLAEQASNKESMVIRLLGNHEIMNMGLLRRFQRHALLNIKQFATKKSLEHEFVPESLIDTPKGGYEPYEIKRFESFTKNGGTYFSLIGACDPKVMVQIGPFLFMHAGVSMKAIGLFEQGKRKGIIPKGANLADFANETIRRSINNEKVYDETNEDMAKFYYEMFCGEGSLLWDREYGQENSVYNSQQTMDTMEMYNTIDGHSKEDVKKFVVAHCPQWMRAGGEGVYVHSKRLDLRKRISYGNPLQLSMNASSQGINCSYDGCVWRVDVGMSRAMDHDKTFVDKHASIESLQEYCRSRLPSALRIEFTKETKYVTSTVVAKYPLRRTTNSHGHHV
jgi:hypothetical protein